MNRICCYSTGCFFLVKYLFLLRIVQIFKFSVDYNKIK